MILRDTKVFLNINQYNSYFDSKSTIIAVLHLSLHNALRNKTNSLPTLALMKHLLNRVKSFLH